MINAPFDNEKVKDLNILQSDQRFHSYTCDARNKCREKSHGGELIATKDGWVCPCGEYTQDWSH